MEIQEANRSESNSLYPSTLFHFTQKKYLFEILRYTFRVSYAREKITAPKHERKFAVPMVSFCDIKLAEIKYFIEKDYGNFGIWLTKEWANRNGLNPVLYINKHCNLADNLIEGLNGIYSCVSRLNKMDDINRMTKSYHNIMNMYRYVKNYEGKMERNGVPDEVNYRFADEREWRYVPPLGTAGVEPFVAISNILTRKRKEEYNERISHIRLSFPPEDIEYLFVEKESDIIELIDYLDFAKSQYGLEIRRKLASRILTIEQIKNDF
jgi:hypothetical protein